LHDPALGGRLRAGALAAVTVLALAWATEFDPRRLVEAETRATLATLLAGFLPPALGREFLLQLARETWRTVAMATTGMSLALALALPLSLLTCPALSISALSGRMGRGPRWARGAIRAALAILRTVPEIVWALVFVRVSGVGLGPTAGVLAIALSYAGMLGKVYAEILESADRRATRALLVNGSSRGQAFFYGLLPQAAGELASYTVYRWECAIRSSVVLGFVGAGGLGQMVDTAIKSLAGGEVTTLLLVFVLLVAWADRISAHLREALR
jgi:phosphonate transport system permease protein